MHFLDGDASDLTSHLAKLRFHELLDSSSIVMRSTSLINALTCWFNRSMFSSRDLNSTSSSFWTRAVMKDATALQRSANVQIG
ncbi:hypothetical protein DYB37_011160 [Aphanomyces astaci]|uniref:Uncharacterized protein n=2 Tax=Aphanomyces astaci TaxID=112090 RepID=A0A3R6X6W8_APHAT|nr:hypothetical protein DYB35_003229 [Aphanomyces astaci]RHZ13893.1 hypothetical protein DYB37_011160 [Aphanomyces astaci]